MHIALELLLLVLSSIIAENRDSLFHLMELLQRSASHICNCISRANTYAQTDILHLLSNTNDMIRTNSLQIQY